MQLKIKNFTQIKYGKESKNLEYGYFPVYGSGGIIRQTNSFLYDRESVLIPRKGSLNNIFFSDVPFWVTDTMFYTIIDEEKVLPLFFYYALKQIDFTILNSGTGVPSLTLNTLNNILINIPKREEQEKISTELRKIDITISLNNSIISKLEEMAKMIYEYWFLQFDFPNHEGKPYASSGGAMKYSKELGREIPIDWDILNLWERFKFEKGIEIGAKQYLSESRKNRVLFWRVGDMNGTCSTYADKKLFGELLLQPRDICVSFDGSVGKVDFGLVGGYSSGIRNIYDRLKKIDNSVIYQIFKSDYIQQLIHKYATGSNILHASGSITNMRIPYNKKVFEEYQKIIKPMFDKMLQAKQENQKLTQLRDWLLPMLMNGQARVE
ncbi:restriction endonuclease subunit S [Helicobacter cholecystus]|uniref:Restriction endonuclease subunit S n=1 Tax=Helicobacter cholecystus TaxID=45498 RepID=A0A3D8IXH6_9HELI|nr:restriction endonuclease subunit S [Helicobacter cholecystus]RDU69304.1 restriction endonuclease subunit S [Helicobacter cholecystus]VEJ24382.1 type I R-M system S protein [Helicobacter cholecystus]